MHKLEDKFDLLDPKLLSLFDLIYSTGSVTRAGELMGQSQPTVSIWLSKLRLALNDPLFVRTPKGMLPTPRASFLICRVREALHALRQISQEPADFDPIGAKRTFRLCMTDAGDITMLKPLLSHIMLMAPGIALDASRIDVNVGNKLTTGEVDLALGVVPELDTGFYQQTLYIEDWVCLCSANHPRLKDMHSLASYTAEAHISFSTRTGSVLNTAVERQQIARRIVLELPGYLSLPSILTDSCLVATLPRRIAYEIAKMGALTTFACPVRAPPITVKQYWHTRFQHDPAHIWLRSMCAGLFSGSAESAKSTNTSLPIRTTPLRLISVA